MALTARYIQLSIMLALSINISAHAEQTLTMQLAVRAALERDSLIQVYQARGDAYRAQSIAEDTLPDPKIKLGLMNVPTDTYSFNQEPMTQVQLGVQQMFPRGDSLEIKSQRAISMSVSEDAKTENQRRKIKREVREAWLELFYWSKAKRVVQENYNIFRKLVTVTKQQYAAGRQKQQDVILSELELGMLDDREMQITTQLETNQAKLNKYIGTALSAMPLDTTLPVLMRQQHPLVSLESHPMLLMEQAMVTINEKNVELAKQSYKPSWMIDVTYGKREKTITGVKRADFASAMVVFDLPLFTGDRQDKNVAVSKAQLNSALNSREERKRALTQMWQVSQAKEKYLSLRIKQYKEILIPKSGENTKAAMYAYQSGRGSFTALMRAQITELETQLRALRLNVDHKKIQAQQLYLTGENS